MNATSTIFEGFRKDGSTVNRNVEFITSRKAGAGFSIPRVNDRQQEIEAYTVMGWKVRQRERG